MAICPKCGQQIPVDEMAEHMRIELIDPKYAGQRQLMFDRMKGASSATDQEITRSLSAFASRRTDIFGSEEVEIGKSVDHTKEASKEDKSIWDGHTASINSTTAATKSMDQGSSIKGNTSDKPGIGPDIPSQLPIPQPKVYYIIAVFTF
jgi:splicing factor 3A subunit 1